LHSVFNAFHQLSKCDDFVKITANSVMKSFPHSISHRSWFPDEHTDAVSSSDFGSLLFFRPTTLI
jgi:hypothetical protein